MPKNFTVNWARKGSMWPNHLLSTRLKSSGLTSWENDNIHNENGWKGWRICKLKNLESQPWVAIDALEVTSAINKTNNWKSPGKDKVPNFWLKYLESLHEDMAKAYTNITENRTEMLEWLTDSLMILLLKTEETKNPKKLQTYHTPPNHVQGTHIHPSKQNIHIFKRASAPSIWTEGM